MPAGAVEILIRADARTAIYTLDKLGMKAKETAGIVSGASTEETAAFDRVGIAAERTRGRMTKLAGGLGFLGLALGIKDVVQGGMQLQAQQVQLQSALKTTGQSVSGTYDQLYAASERLATQGGFSTPENLSSLTSFVRETHSATKSQQMLSLATSIARGTGQSLAGTTQLVARAYTGQVGRLQKLIGPMVAVKNASFHLSQAHKEEVIRLSQQYQGMGKVGSAMLKQAEIQRGITPQQAALATLQDKHATATQFMAAAQRVFAGATQRYGETAAGAMAKMRNSVKMLTDSIGVGLLPIVTFLLHGLTFFVGILGKNKIVLGLVMGAVVLLTGALVAHKIATKAAEGASIILGVAEKALGIAYDEGAAATLRSRIALIASTLAEKVSATATGVLALAQKALGLSYDEAAASALASKVGSIATTVAYGVQTVATGALTVATTIAAGAMGILGLAMDALPIVAIIAAIVALVYLVVTHFHTIVNAVKSAFEFIVKIIGDAIDFIGGIFSKVWDFITTPFVTAFKFVEKIVGGVIKWIGGHWKLLLAILTGPIGLAVYFVVQHFAQIKSVVMAVVNFIRNLFSTMWHVISYPFVKAWDIIKKIFNTIKSAVQAVGRVVKGVFGGIAGVFKGVGNFIGGAVSTLTFGLLAGGGVVRPRPGVTGPRGTDRIHGWLTQGEGVLNTAAMANIGGEGGLNALNSGQIPGSLSGGGGGGTIVIQPSPVVIRLDSRTLATAVIRWQLQRAARGPSSLSGGSLVTGVAGATTG